jgi:hypothetical protein
VDPHSVNQITADRKHPPAKKETSGAAPDEFYVNVEFGGQSRDASPKMAAHKRGKEPEKKARSVAAFPSEREEEKSKQKPKSKESKASKEKPTVTSMPSVVSG